MKFGNRFRIFSLFLVAAYLLSACGGALPKSSASETAQNQSGAPKEVVFTGVVESIDGNQWVVNGQTFTVDSQAALDPNIAVGATVTIDATVAQDGSVVAQRVRSSNQTSDNSNSSNDNGSNSNSNQNDNSNANSNDNSNGNTNDNTNGNDSTTEVSGVVGAITADSITVDGVIYNIADFSEFKDTIAVGDQVQLEVIVNPDGTFTILEVGKPDSINNDNGNGNSNDGSIGENGNNNSNDGSVGENGNSNSNSDDDHGGNSNSNDGGDDSGSDDGGNSNGD